MMIRGCKRDVDRAFVSRLVIHLSSSLVQVSYEVAQWRYLHRYASDTSLFRPLRRPCDVVLLHV